MECNWLDTIYKVNEKLQDEFWKSEFEGLSKHLRDKFLSLVNVPKNLSQSEVEILEEHYPDNSLV